MYGDICLIDLRKTLYYFRLSFSILQRFVFFKQPIWFINLDRSKEEFVRFGASLAGEFFCCRFWIRGMLSNYVMIFKLIQNYWTTPFFIRSKKNIRKLSDLSKNWFLTRFTWPRAVFVSSAFINNKILVEALVAGIPSFSIVDTNIKYHNYLIPIPGNDQSGYTSLFYNNLVGSTILRWKFVNLIQWFTNVRKGSRLVTFEQWIRTKFKLNRSLNFKFLVKKVQNFRFSLSLGLRLGFTRHGREALVKTWPFLFLTIEPKVIMNSLLRWLKYFKRLDKIFLSNFWLREVNFGVSRRHLKRKRFVCKNVLRFSTLNFLKYRVKVANLKKDQLFIYLAQTVFLNALGQFYFSGYFGNLKTRRWVRKNIRKGLQQPIFLKLIWFKTKLILPASLIYKFNLGQLKSRICTPAQTLRFRLLKWFFFDKRRFLRKKKNRKFLGLPDAFFTRERFCNASAVFCDRGFLGPFPFNLGWYYYFFLYLFKLPSYKVKYAFELDSNAYIWPYNLVFLYENMWWRKVSYTLLERRRQKNIQRATKRAVRLARKKFFKARQQKWKRYSLLHSQVQRKL
jgi:ribosomal protein S2